MKLGEAPRMEAAQPFSLAHTSTRANMRQALKDDGRTRSGILDDMFGEHMVMVFALPKQFARELTRVAFR
ncbi:hypothetical protein KSX_03990 [Ktedonospora formicarum]|uniref:Uncharacterized protein n=1 Tax=Ktedonospora formicarum TaxID=2778364 RepID=A0A8J3MPY4_9CHLR|nr:hypothetical protein KSX_03990 [Ktedonospora formicarum]